MTKSITCIPIFLCAFFISATAKPKNDPGALNNSSYSFTFFAAASQFGLWAEDYRSGTYSISLGKNTKHNWYFSFQYTQAQNVRLFAKSYNKDGIYYLRNYSTDHFFKGKIGKDWTWIGFHFGLLGYDLGGDYWGMGADTIPIPLPAVTLTIGKLDNLFLSFDTYDNIEFGKYYYTTSPVSAGLGFHPNLNSLHYFGIVGFKTESGFVLKNNFSLFKNFTITIQSIYHFHKKVFGIGLGTSYRLN